MMLNAEMISIIFYVIMTVAIGFWVSKNNKTDDDYFVAGRSLGPVLSTFSIFATWFGAETCMSSAGAVYSKGLAAMRTEPLGYAFCILLMGIFFAKRLWNKKITTIPELLRHRYSPSTEKLGVLLLLPSAYLWAGAQIRAFGTIIQNVGGYDFTLATTVAALVVITYTVTGGLLADAYTDLIQGITLVIGMIIIFYFITKDQGGFTATMNNVHPDKLNLTLKGETWMQTLDHWLMPMMGSLITQELVIRVLAAKNATIARRSCFIASFMYLAIGFIPVTIGLIGHHYFPTQANPDDLIPSIAKMHLPYMANIIFTGALVSAILSTVDSTLLAISSMVTHDIVYPLVPNMTEKRKVMLARFFVVTSGIVAYAIAFTSDSIFQLVEFSSSMGGPIVLVLVAIGLYSKIGGAWEAGLATLVGMCGWFYGYILEASTTPFLLCVGLTIATFLATLLVRKVLGLEKESVPS